jgi:glycosyltransferase involved in cell wall biosynthesis
MRILWVKTDFLHPTTRGGQIRTLEILRRLHKCHEIHYVAFHDPGHAEGLKRSPEYCSYAYPVPRRIRSRRSFTFLKQLVFSLFSRLPFAVGRYRSREMQRMISSLLERQRFDIVVCDFLTPAPNILRLEGCLLFQHNVETMIWQRFFENAKGPIRRFYFALQASAMLAYERSVCRSVAHVIAVSEKDAELMRSLFEISNVSIVPTGVDVDFFTPPPSSLRIADLTFVGSMDWLPNIDAVSYFVREVLPLIRRRRPDCSLVIVGRDPPPAVRSLADGSKSIRVTGTVPDIRPYLWGSLVSIVPLRIGGGTRLKIYESMAARVPVVSSAIGAEGLSVSTPDHIRIADTPESFANACLELLDNPSTRSSIADAAWELVASKFSWEQVVHCFDEALQRAVHR